MRFQADESRLAQSYMGKKNNPKDALADRRKMPSPASYTLPSSIEIKTNKRFTTQNFDSTEPRFKHTGVNPAKTTQKDVGPGTYSRYDENLQSN
jgi:hypothetical protein